MKRLLCLLLGHRVPGAIPWDFDPDVLMLGAVGSWVLDHFPRTWLYISLRGEPPRCDRCVRVVACVPVRRVA